MSEEELFALAEKAEETWQSEDLERVLISCIEDGTDYGLTLILQLATLNLTGNPYKYDFMRACILTALCWQNLGFIELEKTAVFNQNGRTQGEVINVLSHASVYLLNAQIELLKKYCPNLSNKLAEFSDTFDSKEFVGKAKDTLFGIVTNISPEEPVTIRLLTQLQALQLSPVLIGIESVEKFHSPFNMLFTAVLSRWFRINNLSLNNFNHLINSEVNEEIIHQFLNQHSYILEPFYANIWSKPRLGESLIADFIIQLLDDSYIVVEIEKPSDQIFTGADDLTAKVNHAVRQVLEYRDWLSSNQLYARQNYPNIWRPGGLVVIGLESNLTENQKLRLKQENESRHGIVRIVGFDWLHHRAESVYRNLIKHSSDRFSI